MRNWKGGKRFTPLNQITVGRNSILNQGWRREFVNYNGRTSGKFWNFKREPLFSSIHPFCKYQPFRNFHSDKTIFQLSSGKGRAGVAVIRVSGPKVREVIEKISLKEVPTTREAAVRTLYHLDKSPIDKRKGIVIYYEGPKSFTGEDVGEFHVHGGKAVISAMLSAISSVDRSLIRFAEPGEFTKRAFYNGKMDLTEVEGLSDLLLADTEQQRVQAFHQMSGRLKDLYEQWRKDILHIQASVEAVIDFGDDMEDIELSVMSSSRSLVLRLIEQIDDHLNDNRKGERMREGIHISLVGPPNSGKSSLLNLLADRQAAIVSPIAGTTRDVIEVSLDIGGYPVILSDTAGLRHSEDLIEREGIKRSLSKLQTSDISVGVIDSTLFSPESFISHKKDFAIQNLNEKCEIILFNKCDLLPSPPISLYLSIDHKDFYFISCKSEEGIHLFLKKLEEKMKLIFDDSSEKKDLPLITRERYRNQLILCRDYLHKFINEKHTLDLSAELLRLSVRSLGKITGKVELDDMLDILFSEFCIGK